MVKFDFFEIWSVGLLTSCIFLFFARKGIENEGNNGWVYGLGIGLASGRV
jgi:hypothetical protein